MMVEEERPLGGQMVEEEAEYEEPSAEAMAQYGDGLAQVGLSTQQRCDPLVPTSTGRARPAMEGGKQLQRFFPSSYFTSLSLSLFYWAFRDAGCA